MKLRFGVTFGSRPAALDKADAEKYQLLAALADDYGVDAIGTHDSAFLDGDAFVRATLLAQATKRARIGLRPTNPVTREPQVMASFLLSLDALTDGRAFIDLASGDSAVFNVGLRPASRARIASYVSCVRSLLMGLPCEFDGRQQSVRWSSPDIASRVRISICAEGPRMLHLAGRVGDWVAAGTGLLPDIIENTRSTVEEGTAAAGRPPQSCEIWYTMRAALDEDRDEARKRVKATVANMLNHSSRFGLEGKGIPLELEAKVREYVGGYVLKAHGVVDGSNVRRMDELGLTDYAIQRWAVFGNPEDWIDQLQRIGAAGATRLWINLGVGQGLDGQMRSLRLFGDEVLPYFS